MYAYLDLFCFSKLEDRIKAPNPLTSSSQKKNPYIGTYGKSYKRATALPELQLFTVSNVSRLGLK